jgi:uncharacterized protein (TIGR02001 family)
VILRLAPWLGCAFGLLALPAAAQVSGSVALASDYRLRGVSLTDRQPALSLAAAFDGARGFYAGGAVTAEHPGGAGPRLLGHETYLGFSRRGGGGATWDVGVHHVDLSVDLERRYRINYTQGYVGVSRGPLGARLSVAPDYPRQGVATAYAELNGAVRPIEGWRVFGHAGVLVRLGGYGARDGRSDRYDATVGVAREFTHWELRLTGTAVTPRPEPKRSGSRPGVALAAAVFF